MGPLFWLPTRGSGSKRRVSTSPMPPVPGAVLWLVGDNAPNSVGGTNVATWPDASGNGNNATQATVASQPLGLSNQINGHAAVVFDGVNDVIDSMPDAPGPETLFLVVQFTTPTATYVVTDSSSGMTFREVYVTSSKSLNFYSGSNVSAGFIDNQFHILCVVFNGALSSLYKDGVLSGSGDCGSDGRTGFRIGAAFNDTDVFSGKVAEVLDYVSILNDTQRQSVQSYLGTKYAITLGQPQISSVDFTGLTGASFFTGNFGKSFALQSSQNALPLQVWFNTGTETAPSPTSAYSGQVEFDCGVTDTSNDLAGKLRDLINNTMPGLGYNYWTATASGNAGLITDNFNLPYAQPTQDIDSGVTCTTTQVGSGNS